MTVPPKIRLTQTIAKLAAELNKIDAMLGDFSRAKKDYGHVVIVLRAQLRIYVDVNFREFCAKFLEQRRQLCFGFFAKMASGTRIDRDVARARELQAPVLGPRVSAGRLGETQPPALDQLLHDTFHREGVTQVREGSRARTGLIEGRENLSFQIIHDRNNLYPISICSESALPAFFLIFVDAVLSVLKSERLNTEITEDHREAQRNHAVASALLVLRLRAWYIGRDTFRAGFAWSVTEFWAEMKKKGSHVRRNRIDR